MLLKYSSTYLLARGVPGIIQLISLTLFTRLLLPAEYGKFSLVMTGAGLANAVLYNWIRLGLLRFRPEYDDNQTVFLSTIFRCYGILCLATGLVGALTLFFIADPIWKLLVAIGICLVWITALFEINLQWLRSKMSPMKYGVILTSKSLLAVGLGCLFIYFGMGPSGVLFGTMIGMSLPLVAQIYKNTSFIKINVFDKKLFRDLLTYGMPLTATFVLNFIISSSDKFFIAYYLGTNDTGLYSVGYNLGQHTIGMILMIVNLGGYPLIVNVLEKQGVSVAYEKLNDNFIFLLGIGLPATVGLSLLARNISGIFLGAEFSEAAQIIIPWIAFSALIGGMKAFYFDLSFHLGKRTVGQVWVALFAAMLNICLNLALIPKMGLLGAAYATILSYTAGIVLSSIVGRKIFKLPIPWKEVVRIFIACLVMAIFLFPTKDMTGILPLCFQMTLGITVYLILFILLNINNSKYHFFRLSKYVVTAK